MVWGIFDSSEYLIARWLFIKGMGLTYLFAFLSLYVQIKGLWSSKGIDPIHGILDRYEKVLGKKNFFRIPSIFWLWRSDQALHLVAAAGILASLLVLAGIAVVPSFLILYLAYLSFCAVGSIFLSYQWDALLLELGFLSIFYAWVEPPSPLFMLLTWFLLFRFMIASGAVKLLSGDPNWRNGRAMCFHHETQPLPTAAAWYLHNLPDWMHRASCYAMFVIELLIPFGIFGPPPVQLVTFILLAGLQVVIAISGNYCFFNFMTVVLCVTIVPDQYLVALTGGWIPAIGETVSLAEITVIFIAGMVLWVLNIFRLIDIGLPWLLPHSYRLLVAPFSISNSYGLFAVMTTERNEITVEGSADGKVWKSYNFKWKPNKVSQRPRYNTPHQPRLDWQMWFAALGSFQQNPWFANFLLKLLQGQKEVLDLMEYNPFPDAPPKFIRARLTSYHFTTPEEAAQTGNWWNGSPLGAYSSTLSLRPQTEGAPESDSTTFNY